MTDACVVCKRKELEAEIERLTAERAYIAETLYAELRADNARLRVINQDHIEAVCKAVAEIERLTALKTPASAQLLNITKGCLDNAEADNERLRAALQALHDWYVEYARINNLFNGDGTPATFHELLDARAALEPKP